MASKQMTYVLGDAGLLLAHCVVYSFSDPRTNEVRYIGKTTGGLHRRVKRHLSGHYLKEPTYKNNWLRGLLAAGERPVVDVLEICAVPEDLIEAERFHIAYWKAIGARLTNGTDGGDGLMAGAKRSQEICEKISRAHKARLANPEIRKAWVSRIAEVGRANRGMTRSEATRAQMSATHKKRPRQSWSEEHRLAISRGKGGRSIVDEAGNVYATAAEASRQLGVNAGCICQVLSGRNSHTGGHTFHYVDDTSSAIAIAIK